MERKDVDIVTHGFKFSDEGNGSVDGFGAAFNNRDSYGDIIRPGAFAACLAEFLHRGFMPVGHAWGGLPVAYPVDARETDYGLFVRGDFHSFQSAQDARTWVRERLDAGKVVGLSIGFGLEPADVEYSADGTTRFINSISKLYEISIVSAPANDNAVATAVKAEGDTPSDDGVIPTPEGPHGGLRLEDEFERLVRVPSLRHLDRVRAIAAMRIAEQKEGRVLSGANEARVTQMRDMHLEMASLHAEMGSRSQEMADVCQELLDMAKPKTPKAADPARVASVRASYLRIRAMQSGIATGDVS